MPGAARGTCSRRSWVGSTRPPTCAPNPNEVAEIHQPRVSKLLEPSAYEEVTVRLDHRPFVNATLHWPEGHVFGLSTDLLIEALEWGLELSEGRGPQRLQSLEAFLRMRAKGEEPQPADERMRAQGEEPQPADERMRAQGEAPRPVDESE